MRTLVCNVLLDFIRLNHIKPVRVAVVGGSSLDPEVVAIKKVFPDVVFFFFGVDNSENISDYNFFDLNQINEVNGESYELVLCSQVLEHIWDLSCGFDQLISLVSNHGYLWINCPASNRAHGSPEYFSAGYSPEYLVKNLEIRGQRVLKSGTVGSKRQYFMTHILRSWPTDREHAHPVFGYKFQPGTPQGIAWKLVRELPGRLLATLFSKSITCTIDYATESYVISTPRESSRP
jgi:hypothetical protein